MTEIQSDEMIVIGKVVAPHGVRGDLRIFPETDRPEIFSALSHVFIGHKSYHLVSVRPHKNIYIFHLTGIETRDDAELLRGSAVSLPFGELPPRKTGSYYYFQLIGLPVYEQNGSFVGRITEILQTGANDVYVVKGADEKDICLPAIPSCILSVSLEEQKMTVQLPEWDEDHEN